MSDTRAHGGARTRAARGSSLIAIGLLVLAGGAWAGAPAGTAAAASGSALPPATYHVKLLSLNPPKLAVTAVLPIDGQQLTMDTTRPAGIKELDSLGWPALTTYLRVADATGRPVGVSPAGPSGWTLERTVTGRLTLDYEVDYTLLAGHDWPAPRESGITDADHMVLAGRSLFITTPALGDALVTFFVPRGWRPVTPWAASSSKTAQEFSTGSARELVENLLAFTRTAPDVVTAGGFRLHVVSMGHWLPARAEVRRVLQAVVPRLVGLIGAGEGGNYLVVQLPVVEAGGESFRNSFAMTVAAPPTRGTRAVWGNTLAHEIFHYWNGWRLAGSDYTATQWFHEGFTEYAANLSLVTGRAIDPAAFAEKLSAHCANYRNLTTTLENTGSRKGPPLYSAGALVAFSWDVLIRQATGGKRNLGDFFRSLWRQTDSGRQPYEWRDIRSALDSVAPRDWDAFHDSYIKGSEKLPLAEILPLAGLRLEETAGAAPRVVEDPSANASAKNLWRSLVQGR